MDNNLLHSLTDIKRKPNPDTNIDNGERALSIIAGGYLLYKSLKKITKHPLMGVQGVAAGGMLLYRGVTGVCPIYKRLNIDTTDPQAIHIHETITVNASRDKVYGFWRELANLPKFMKHLKQVTETSRTESYWVANTPGNLIELNWKAEIT
ncbi:MAG: YgaP-like transmembrane domain, partial [Bacteroidia bacterium]